MIGPRVQRVALVVAVLFALLVLVVVVRRRRRRPPAPSPEPHAGAVVEEARRITREAVGGE